jgi:transcriptional regulator with XRE-family HTH domain
MTFGQQLRAWRRRRLLSQQGLAERLGVSSITVQGWERDRSVPRPTHQSGLVEALGLSPDEFVTARQVEQAGPGGTVAV